MKKMVLLIQLLILTGVLSSCSSVPRNKWNIAFTELCNMQKEYYDSGGVLTLARYSMDEESESFLGEDLGLVFDRPVYKVFFSSSKSLNDIRKEVLIKFIDDELYFFKDEKVTPQLQKYFLRLKALKKDIDK